MPFITNRIKKFLSESIHKFEFSHTILHKQHFVDFSENIFDKKSKNNNKNLKKPNLFKNPSQNILQNNYQ